MMVTPDSFPESFARLTESERAIVRFKALVFATDTKEKFREGLSRAEVRDGEGRQFSHARLNPLLDGLVRKGFLTKTFLCKRNIAHRVTLDACASDRSTEFALAVRTVFPPPENRDYPYYLFYSSGSYVSPSDDFLRTLRLAVYFNDSAAFGTHMERLRRPDGDSLVSSELREFLLATPFDLAWLETRDPAIQFFLFKNRLSAFLSAGRAMPGWKAWLDHYRERQHRPGFEAFRDRLMDLELLAGDLAALEAKLDIVGDAEETAVRSLGFRGSLAFCRGDDAAALSLFQAALKLLKKETRRRKIFLSGPAGLFFLLALMRTRDPSHLKTAEQGLGALLDLPTHGFLALEAAFLLLRGQDDKGQHLLDGLLGARRGGHLERALAALVQYSIAPKVAANFQPHFADDFAAVRETLPLVARILAEVLAKVTADPGPYAAYLAETDSLGVRSFTEILRIAPRWERGLENLENFFTEPARSARPQNRGKGKRLAWLVDPENLEIQPVQQVLGKSGAWSSGRNVALSRLHRLDPKLDFLTEQDRAVTKALRKENTGWYRADTLYYFDQQKAWRALVGHPCVYHLARPGRSLELVAALPEVEVKRRGADYRVTLSHGADSPKVFVEAETPTRLRVVDFSNRMVRLARILGEKGMAVPAEGGDRLLGVLEKASASLPVDSDALAGKGAGTPGDAMPRVQLQPLDAGLRVNVRVRPFGAGGPDYPVGRGARAVMASLNGKAARVQRDLARERQMAEALLAVTPTLRDNYAGGFEWILEDLETCLELLTELDAVPDAAFVEWPEGTRLSVTRVLDGRSAFLKIASAGDWFKLAGEVKIDEEQVVAMQALLGGLDRAHGRFVPIGEGQFLALSNHFKAELEKLRRLGELTKDGLRFHGLGALAMRDLLEGAGKVEGNRKWNAHLARIENLGRLTPTLPSTIRAELRDYQEEGFVWLSRLAHWGVGACLADDMGVGKTLQALTVMVGSAADGPCLVVAPTSVCHNWVAEIDRFAPTLTPVVLNHASDRKALLEHLGPMDVLICSYGLLVQESETLGRMPWRVVVLDEAQAIKNAETRRAKAAFALQGGFRLAMTGTPIENNLGELWSLFNFVNPGLLGTEKSFQRRFLNPAGNGVGTSARQALKALVAPFILRRTKAMVLSELPPRIEQTLRIEMDSEEAAFYESLRRRALETISGLGQAVASRRRFHVLAEITRLRRACCHPSLIEPGLAVGGAKLKAFLGLVDELGVNGHKALVFSQYVGFLNLVRAELDRKGISYQYLDGATPLRDREKRVAAFQSGVGDLFLISLKAGGAGLNLTAADYVVHLDPWWNPAVEDQASDRAHRIGQHRPVTIYRLIMAGTIEERITELHRSKRDLAADLLAGAEVAGRLGEAEFLRLVEGAATGKDAGAEPGRGQGLGQELEGQELERS